MSHSDDEEQSPLPNTAEHERYVSQQCKRIVAAATDAMCQAMLRSFPKIDGEDPLSAERYVHLADLLASIAQRMYQIGEQARINSVVFTDLERQKRGLYESS